MKKINSWECLNLLRDRFPKYDKYRQPYVAEWGNHADFMFAIMSPLQEYTLDVIRSHNTSEIKRIFDTAEYLMVLGDQDVQNGVATQFLENLMNANISEFILIIPYLGEESIEYCRAWDKFTGVKTKGLWYDEQE